MKILVTGASGLLGIRLCKALLSEPAPLPGVTHIVAADTSAVPH